MTHFLKKMACRLILERTDDPAVFDEEKCEEQLVREAADWLFVSLSLFTYIYFGLLVLAFFGLVEYRGSPLVFILEMLRDPYLTALGVYVIIKEIRKEQRQYPSRYIGESFVALWILLAVIATTCVVFLPSFHFDDVYRIIISNGLVVLLLYIGSLMHRP